MKINVRTAQINQPITQPIDGQVFEAVTKKLDALPGLGDRVQLFLMEDPTPLTPEEVRPVLLNATVAVCSGCTCLRDAPCDNPK